MSKLDMIDYLSQVPDASTADVAASLGLSLPAAGMGLLRLVRSGLAGRTFDLHDQCYYYALTGKGRARLQFLQRGDT